MIKKHFNLIVLFSFFSSLVSTIVQCAQVDEPIIGGPCQGCELVYVGMPKLLKSYSSIAPENEEGEPLLLRGIVNDLTGKKVSGVIVYAYQTDTNGQYPKGSTKHGKLRGWAMTDENGLYQFKTIRPGSYPGRDSPQHIHLHVIEQGKGTYYIDDVTFQDDPLLTQQKKMNKPCRGGCGVTIPQRNDQGTWQVQRDIFLGKNINDY